MKTNLIKSITILFFLQNSLSVLAYADPAPQAKAATPPAAAAQKQTAADTADPEAPTTPAKQGAAPVANGAPAEPESYSFTKLLAPGGKCKGKEALLNSFVNEVEIPDGAGGKKKYKGKLTEKEDEYGDRNFNFEKLETVIYSDNNDEATNECLFYFSDTATTEWIGYFQIMNETFHCGLAFNEDGTPMKVVPAEGKTEECDVLVGDEKMSDYMKRNMDRLADVVNTYDKKLDDFKKRHAATAPAADKAKTEAATACPGSDCSALANGFKPSKYIKTIEERKCCDNLNTRWASLGFTTVRDNKADDRICKEMIDKDTDAGYCEDTYCVKDVGNCLTNFAAAFAKDFVSSVVDSWKFWAWGDQIYTLIRELLTNPWEAMKSIAKNVTGFDMEYLSCLNKKSQTQYFCQMVGKLTGSSAGFSAGMGALVGLGSGVLKGLAAKSGAVSKIIAKDPKASLLIKPIKEARDGALKGFKLGALAPLHILGLSYKGATGILKGGARLIKGIPNMVTKGKAGIASGIPAAAVALSRGAASLAARTGGEYHAAFGQGVKAAGSDLSQGLNKGKTAATNAGEAAAGEVAGAEATAKLKTLDQVNEAIVKVEQERALVSNQLKSEIRKNKPIRTYGRPKSNEPKAAPDQPKPEPKALTNTQKKAKAARDESAAKIRTLRNQLAERSIALEELKAQRTNFKTSKAANGQDLNRALILAGTGAQKLQKDAEKLGEDKKEEAPATAAPVNGLGVGAVAPDTTGKKDGTSAKPKVEPKTETPAAPVIVPKTETKAEPKKGDGKAVTPAPGKTDETSASDEFSSGQ